MGDIMKDMYYKMKAWFVMKRLEKLETDGAETGPSQDMYSDNENDPGEDPNSFQ